MKQVSAGHVLTQNLLNRLNDKVWYFGVKGHLRVTKEKDNKIDILNLFDKNNRTIVAIPKDAIKRDADKFIADFEKTMASTQYQIELI